MKFTESTDEKKYEKLRKFNLVMGILHLVQGILMVVLSNDFALPVTRGFLEYDPGAKELLPTTTTMFHIRLGPLVASFLFMSALAHFLIATVLYGRYRKGLSQGINRYRWYEYSLSASVMIVLIAMLTGIYNLGTLLLVFFMNAAMIFFGLRMEVHNQKTDKPDWKPFIYGCIAGVIP